MLKLFYLNRIKTLKNDIKKTDSYVNKQNELIKQYIVLIEDSLVELKSISNNENIEPRIKYIQLNEKTTIIEKISSKIEELYKDINLKALHINKEKSILIQNCVEDHRNLTEDEIIDTIVNLLSKD